VSQPPGARSRWPPSPSRGSAPVGADPTTTAGRERCANPLLTTPDDAAPRWCTAARPAPFGVGGRSASPRTQSGVRRDRCRGRDDDLCLAPTVRESLKLSDVMTTCNPCGKGVVHALVAAGTAPLARYQGPSATCLPWNSPRHSLRARCATTLRTTCDLRPSSSDARER
jgi:hypothetical protein